MDEYKHCLNCLLSRSKILDIAIQMNPEDKKELDKHYDELVQWFKDTYELKRKPKLSDNVRFYLYLSVFIMIRRRLNKTVIIIPLF